MNNRICIVTDQFGDMSIGVEGHLMLAVAEASLEAGYIVDVILVPPSKLPAVSISQNNLSENINLIKLQDISSLHHVLDEKNSYLEISYHVFNYVADRQYKSVHFFERGAFGFYCTLAKSQGLLKSVLVTHLIGPTGRNREREGDFATLAELEHDAAEYRQTADSDLVLGDSLDICEWLRSRGTSLPNFILVDWPVPRWVNGLKTTRNGDIEDETKSGQLPESLIFLGQQNRVSGYEAFLDILQNAPKTSSFAVWIFGPFSQIDFEFTGILALRKLTNVASELHFATDMSFRQVAQQIRTIKNCVCVLPGRQNNMPYELVILQGIGIRTYSSTIENWTIDQHCSSAKLKRTEITEILWNLIMGGEPISKKVRQTSEEIRSDDKIEWNGVLALIEEISAKQISLNKIDRHPLVSVCIAHHDRHYFLETAISAIMEQTYPNVEIIVVDDGSTSLESQVYLDELHKREHRFPLTVIKSENRYLGAARNLAANHARGEFIIFHDDDNVAEPCQVEIFTNSMINSNADILTCLSYSFRDGPHNLKENTIISFFPTGLNTLYSFYSNRFGDANAIFRKASFLELGGFTEHVGLGWEDWEIFLRASIRGKVINVIPVALFNYRTSHNGMLSSGNLSKNFKRIFSMLKEEGVQFGTGLLEQANRDLLLREAKSATVRSIRKEPFFELCQEINHLDPAHPDAKGKFLKLAMATGWRLPESNSGYTHKYQENPVSLSVVRPPEGLKAAAFTTSRLAVIDSLLFARGWSLANGNRGLSPDGILVGDNFHSTVFNFAEPRPDVAGHFKITSPSGDLGFIVICRPALIPPKKWFRNNFTRQQIKEGFQTSAYFKNRKPASIQIDLLMDYVKVRVPLSFSNWRGKIKIDIEVGWQVPIYFAPNQYSLSRIECKKSGFFEFELESASDHVDLVIPKNYHAHIILEPGDLQQAM